jgi:hypothetical protein
MTTPTDLDKQLDGTLHRLILHYHAVGQLKTPANKTDFKVAKQQILSLFTKELKEVERKSRIELPDLPYFEVRAFDKKGTMWVSPTCEVKNLPVAIVKGSHEDF